MSTLSLEYLIALNHAERNVISRQRHAEQKYCPVMSSLVSVFSACLCFVFINVSGGKTKKDEDKRWN